MNTHNEQNATSGCWGIAWPVLIATAIVVVVIIGLVLLGRAPL